MLTRTCLAVAPSHPPIATSIAPHRPPTIDQTPIQMKPSAEPTAQALAELLCAMMEGGTRLVLTRSETPYGSLTATILERGLVVMNAPRPIPGAYTWMGPCRHGRFYAAVEPGHHDATACHQLDAWPVRNLAESEIGPALNHLAVEAGYRDLTTLMTENDLTREEVEQMYVVPLPGCGVGVEHDHTT
jgi:hypothetical protein